MKWLREHWRLTALCASLIVALSAGALLASNNVSLSVCSFDTTGSGGPQAACIIPTDTKGNAIINKATFRYAGAGVTSFATSPTDWVVLTGSSTKLVRVTNVTVCGFATAATSIDVVLIKRTAADTGGTSSAIAAQPLQGETASATAAIYTANPTLGTSISGAAVDAVKINLGATGSAGCFSTDDGTRNTEAIVLSGVAQQLAINLNGVTVPSGANLDYRIEDTEE
jgi:hypothetical protein